MNHIEKKIRNLYFCLFSFLLILLFIFPLYADEGVDFVNSKIDYFNSLREKLANDYTEENKKDIQKKARETAFSVINITEITRLSLGKYYKKVSQKQIKELEFLFQQIISERITQANIPTDRAKIAKSKMPLKILGDEQKKDDYFGKEAHIVKTQVKNKKNIYDIDIYLFKEAEKFYLYDIYVDGASILLDFKNQFARIIKRKGMKYLLKKMREQVSKLKKSQ